MGDVDELLSSALDRYERLKEQEEEAAEQYEKIEALLSLLKDEYDTSLSSMQGRVSDLNDRLDQLEEESDRIAESIPETARSSDFESLKRDIEHASLPDCITREEFARKYC